MASRISPNTPVCVAHDTVSSDATQPIVKLARQDTGSSTRSARRPPNGNWAFNISGVCSRCHHHHSSIQVHVKISDDSTQFGDVRCKKCQGLWVAFGKTNATRLSLLSTISMEPDALELEFRSALDHIIRSTMPIAALSSNLAIIPESASPSRGTSVRSATRSNIRNRAAATINDASPNADEPEGCHGALEDDHYEQSNDKKLGKLSKHTLTRGRKVLIRVQHKAKVGLSRFQNFPSGLRRLFSKESKGYRSHQQEPIRPPPHVSPTMVVSPSLPEEEPQIQAEDDTNVDMDALDVCASSATAADALAALKAFNSQALKNLPPKQKFSWGRRQLTHFKARQSTAVGTSAKVNTESLTDRTGTQPARDYLLDRPQSLAYIGHAFDIHDNSSIYRRPFSVSETNLSDADTIFDGMSISSLPRHLLNEGIHRNQHRSLSPRPLSMQSIPQDWTPYHRNTTEFRRSIDSTATAGVRSIGHNRLSFVSMNRASSIYAAEVPSSQVQLGIDQQINGPLGSQRPRSHSPSPLNPGVDTAQE